MEVDELPTVNADEEDETSSEKIQSIHPPTGPSATDMATDNLAQNKEGATPFSILEFPTYTPAAGSSKSKYNNATYTPSATSSKAKYNNASIDIEKKEIKEFIRILRPHLPRKAKTKAYKMLQNIAKGTVVKSSFQQRIKKKKPKKRPARKQKNPRQLKKLTKYLSVVRRNNRSLYSSSDSCRSNTSCPHCGVSCSRIP